MNKRKALATLIEAAEGEIEEMEYTIDEARDFGQNEAADALQEFRRELTDAVEFIRGQDQSSVTDQLIELRNVANIIGLYDAADWIEENLK